jgi:ubiquinone/menaquinone biosynthesis C-methylase UbiE
MNDLYQKEASEKYYEERFAEKQSLLKQEYMSEWGDDKKNRIYEMIKSLPLPEAGNVIDFGCGAGVFTEVLRQALPNYHIYGTDFSQRAINKAKARYKNCTFIHSADTRLKSMKFDFLFTHHVLEHVYDLEPVAAEMIQFLKEKSSMLHVLPCGNAGSLEYNICSLRKDGIIKERENAFFFEDEGHVRRLKTRQVNDLFSKYGFTLSEEYYSEQKYGAIKWITESNPLRIIRMLNPIYGKDIKSKFILLSLFILLFSLALAKMPLILMNHLEPKRHESFKLNFIYAACLPFYPISKFIDTYLRNKAVDEWNKHNREPNGSEMYLFYIRKAE